MNFKLTVCNKCYNTMSNEEYIKHINNCTDYRLSIRNSKKFNDNIINDKYNEENIYLNKKDQDESNYMSLKEGILTFGSRERNYNDSRINDHNSTIKKYDTFNNSLKNKDNKDYTFSKLSNSDINQYRKPNIEYNSYIIAVVYTLYNMDKIRDYILNDISFKDSKNILACLQNIFRKLNKSKEIINTDELRKGLNDLFESRRKFLIDYPDDPVDALYAFINSLHSYHIKSRLGEIKDTSCDMKCAAHRYVFMDLGKIEECECRGSNKRLLSFHNYIFDIPIDKIIELSEKMQNIEMSKTVKFKANRSESMNLTDIKGKLFSYFKNFLNQSKSNCPQKGNRCNINQVYKSFFINNTPQYININLINESKQFIDLLKIFILIPNVFELATIFNNSNKSKIFYELLGCICVNRSKSYISFFKSGNKWNKYYETSFEESDTYFNLIRGCIKNYEIPILLIYRNNEKLINHDNDLTTDEVLILERFCKNMDNLNLIIQNRFRPSEDIMDYSYETEIKKKNNSINNSHNSSISVNSYNCVSCGYKNNIEDVICIKCKKNNDKSFDQKRKGSEQKQIYKNNSKSTLTLEKEEKARDSKVKEDTSTKFYPNKNENKMKDYNLPKQMNTTKKEKTLDNSSLTSEENKKKVIIKATKDKTWKCDKCEYINKSTDNKCNNCYKNRTKTPEISSDKLKPKWDEMKKDIKTSIETKLRDSISHDSKRKNECNCKKENLNNLCKYCQRKVLERAVKKNNHTDNSLKKSGDDKVKHKIESEIMKDFNKKLNALREDRSNRQENNVIKKNDSKNEKKLKMDNINDYRTENTRISNKLNRNEEKIFEKRDRPSISKIKN